MKGAHRESTIPALRPVKRKRSVGRHPAQPGRGSKGLASAARTFAARILAFELTDAASADLAGRWRHEVDAQERKVVEWFAPAKQAAFKAHAAICRQENEALAPYREARRVINAKLAAWQAAQMHFLNADGQTPAQTELTAGSAPAAAADAECAARVEGVSFRENWRIEVIDKATFVNAIAARPELVNLVEPNLSALAHLARAHKSAVDIPGVRIWCELSVAASRRA